MKCNRAFVYPNVLIMALFFLIVLGSVTASTLKEWKHAELAISYYEKQQLYRIGATEVLKNTKSWCGKNKKHWNVTEGEVSVKPVVCDENNERIQVSIHVKTKTGVSEFGEVVINTTKNEVLEWMSDD
ncbi:hypothetical protein [Bacillus sp. NPDC077027]|uniref:hypothetical protein n=1 Tax=Bacillus sp. NPDC077027 TaxID=3390548 RepID=UPI003CFD2AF1